MRNLKTLVLLASLLLFSNVAQAQVEVIFHILGGLRGIGSDPNKPTKIQPHVAFLEEKDLELLENTSPTNTGEHKDYSKYDGAMIYSPSAVAYLGINIPQGLSMWDGAKWTKAYTTTPVGSLKGDLLALQALLQHPENQDIEEWNGWNIDLSNIDNPNNLKLNGVFFEKVNGEYRVVELHLDHFGFKNISIAKGLEAVAYLELRRNNKLKRLDIKLPNLRNLVFNENQLLSSITLDAPMLTFAKLHKHETLYDFTFNCPQLKNLELVKANRLQAIDLSNCLQLTHLSIEGNSLLSAIDVSKNVNLIELKSYRSNMTTLDLSRNTKLVKISCTYNNRLASIDLPRSTSLTAIYCSDNKLQSLDVSGNPQLAHLSCGVNLLTNIDVSKNLQLVSLYCNINKLQSLDVSKNKELVNLSCGYNKLTTLDVSNNPKLTTFTYDGNPLTQSPKLTKE